MKSNAWNLILWGLILLYGCSQSNDDNPANLEEIGLERETLQPQCESNQTLDTSRGECSVDLPFESVFSQREESTHRIIRSNGIPSHKVGLFGRVNGALNPNEISEQNNIFRVALNPKQNDNLTPLLSNTGPAYSFGVLLNGVELDPVAAEPFPHQGIMAQNVNWKWNLEATNVNIGLDCNNAHVQPKGSYHYHGSPVLYLEEESINQNEMTLVGYAADGFPIYYKYAFEDPQDPNSVIIEMSSSYQLKSGNRPGDGNTAPCGEYNGVYSNDYEFVEGLGTLDQANGRQGVTPENQNGTYYYVITDEFPNIPRYFRGIPSDDFEI